MSSDTSKCLHGEGNRKLIMFDPWKEVLRLTGWDLDYDKIKPRNINIWKVSIFLLCCTILILIKTTSHKLYRLIGHHNLLRLTKPVDCNCCFSAFRRTIFWMLPSWLFSHNRIYTSQNPTVFNLQQISLIGLYIPLISSPWIPYKPPLLFLPHVYSQNYLCYYSGPFLSLDCMSLWWNGELTEHRPCMFLLFFSTLSIVPAQ